MTAGVMGVITGSASAALIVTLDPFVQTLAGLLRARALFGALRATSSAPWRLGEWLVLAGHAALLMVGLAMALGLFGRSLSVSLYGLLMIAAALYASGLGTIARRHPAAPRR